MVTARLARVLGQHVADRGLGIVLAETGFKLASRPDTVRAPDLSFLSADRLPSGDVPDTFWTGPPDLAVEVRSPEDRLPSLAAKANEYLAHGVRLVWIVDPSTRTVTVCAQGSTPAVLDANAALDGGTVVPGFSYGVADLFGVR
jgi:Uma2 family endonuclease